MAAPAFPIAKLIQLLDVNAANLERAMEMRVLTADPATFEFRRAPSVCPFDDYDVINDLDFGGVLPTEQQAIDNATQIRLGFVESAARGQIWKPSRPFQVTMAATARWVNNLRIDCPPGEFRCHPKFATNGPLFAPDRDDEGRIVATENLVARGNVRLFGNYLANAQHNQVVTLAEDFTPQSTQVTVIEDLDDVAGGGILEYQPAGRFVLETPDGDNLGIWTYTSRDQHTLFGTVQNDTQNSIPTTWPAGTRFRRFDVGTVELLRLTTFDTGHIDGWRTAEHGSYGLSIGGQPNQVIVGNPDLTYTSVVTLAQDLVWDPVTATVVGGEAVVTAPIPAADGTVGFTVHGGRLKLQTAQGGNLGIIGYDTFDGSTFTGVYMDAYSNSTPQTWPAGTQFVRMEPHLDLERSYPKRNLRLTNFQVGEEDGLGSFLADGFDCKDVDGLYTLNFRAYNNHGPGADLRGFGIVMEAPRTGGNSTGIAMSSNDLAAHTYKFLKQAVWPTDLTILVGDANGPLDDENSIITTTVLDPPPFDAMLGVEAVTVTAWTYDEVTRIYTCTVTRGQSFRGRRTRAAFHNTSSSGLPKMLVCELPEDGANGLLGRDPTSADSTLEIIGHWSEDDVAAAISCSIGNGLAEVNIVGGGAHGGRKHLSLRGSRGQLDVTVQGYKSTDAEIGAYLQNCLRASLTDLEVAGTRAGDCLKIDEATNGVTVTNPELHNAVGGRGLNTSGDTPVHAQGNPKTAFLNNQLGPYRLTAHNPRANTGNLISSMFSPSGQAFDTCPRYEASGTYQMLSGVAICVRLRGTNLPLLMHFFHRKVLAAISGGGASTTATEVALIKAVGTAYDVVASKTGVLVTGAQVAEDRTRDAFVTDHRLDPVADYFASALWVGTGTGPTLAAKTLAGVIAAPRGTRTLNDGSAQPTLLVTAKEYGRDGGNIEVEVTDQGATYTILVYYRGILFETFSGLASRAAGAAVSSAFVTITLTGSSVLKPAPLARTVLGGGVDTADLFQVATIAAVGNAIPLSGGRGAMTPVTGINVLAPWFAVATADL